MQSLYFDPEKLVQSLKDNLSIDNLSLTKFEERDVSSFKFHYKDLKPLVKRVICSEIYQEIDTAPLFISMAGCNEYEPKLVGEIYIVKGNNYLQEDEKESFELMRVSTKRDIGVKTKGVFLPKNTSLQCVVWSDGVSWRTSSSVEYFKKIASTTFKLKLPEIIDKSWFMQEGVLRSLGNPSKN